MPKAVKSVVPEARVAAIHGDAEGHTLLTCPGPSSGAVLRALWPVVAAEFAAKHGPMPGRGAAVLGALLRQGVQAEALDPGSESGQGLEFGGYDRAFIALHGRGGEDGQIQGALQTIGMPYTGSGVLGSAIASNQGVGELAGREGMTTPPAVELHGRLAEFVEQV